MLKNKQAAPSKPALLDNSWKHDLLDRVTPDIQPPDLTLDRQGLHGTSGAPDHPFHESPFSQPELELVLASVNKKAATGPDNISYQMLLHLPDSYKQILLDVFYQFIQAG